MTPLAPSRPSHGIHYGRTLPDGRSELACWCRITFTDNDLTWVVESFRQHMAGPEEEL